VAWFAHFYTATGVIFAFLAALAIIDSDERSAFFWFFVATVVDSTDGWIARVARVRERTPGFIGERLDYIVDYLTFVFLPVLLLYQAGRLPEEWGFFVASVMLLSSALRFGFVNAKTEDHFFMGFPSYWNILAFYICAANTAPFFNGLLLIVFSALVFLPVGFVYPSRTPTLRPLTVVMCAAWGGVLLLLIFQLPEVSNSLLMFSLWFPTYYLVLSLVLYCKRRSSQ